MALKRPPDADLMAIPTPPSPSLPTASATTATDDEIVTLSLPKKPRIQFNREEFKINPDGVLAGANDLRNRLAAFLPSLKAADEQLEKEKLAGRIADRRIEIDSDSDGSSDSDEDSEGSDSGEGSDEDEDLESGPQPPNTIAEVLISNLLGQPQQQTAAEDGEGGSTIPSSSSKKSKKRSKNKQPYIEMNLGLGVLEELKPSTDGDDKEINERRELIDRIYELRRLQEAREESTDGDQLDEMIISEDSQKKKKVVIEELE